MSDEALSMFNAMRPAPLAPTGDIRPGGDLHSLAMIPGTPGYNARIPRPPCYRCGEDHVPGLAYDHDWSAEPPAVHDEPVSATAIRRPAPVTYDVEAHDTTRIAETPQQRVGLYIGRDDTYVIIVERAPDWDGFESFKVNPSEVVPMINLVRALGIKVSDKTGGDLVMLQQEAHNAGRKPPQNYERNAPSDGDRSPRQQPPAADGAEVDQPEAG